MQSRDSRPPESRSPDEPIVSQDLSEEAQALSAATDEMLRRIGRNLLNFQKIEALLKYLQSIGRISGPVSKLASIREAQFASASGSTMGTLVSKLSDGILSDSGVSHEMPEEVREPWVQFRMAFEPAEEFVELRQRLKALVIERNELAHNFLSKWDATSIEITRRLSDELDAQRERLIPVYSLLSRLVTDMQDGVKAHAEFLASPEGQQEFDSWFQTRAPE